jgi:hypothetical protein
MQLSTIRDEVRWLTKTDTSTFSNTNINREINIAYQSIILQILKTQGYKNTTGKHVSTSLLSTSGLVSGDLGFNGEYPFPTDMLRPIRFELKYAATDTPVPCRIYDMSQNGTSESDDDAVSTLAGETEPIVKFFHDSYFIRPLKTTTGDITGGIHIWYEARQTALSADADEPQFEESLHDLLALMTAERFYMRHPSKTNSTVLRDKEVKLRELRSFYRIRIPVLRQLTPQRINFA